MLSNEEVVLAADAIERAYATMLEIDRIAGLDSTYNTSSNILNVHNTHKGQHIAKVHDMDLVYVIRNRAFITKIQQIVVFRQGCMHGFSTGILLVQEKRTQY